MAYKYIVVDDEPFARKLVLTHTKGIEGISLAGEYGSAVDAVNVLRNQSIDLIFLDIELPELNGLQLIETLKNPPHVILTTAYRHYAVDAFNIDAVDYLVKPISFDRLLKAVNRFFERRSAVPGAVSPREEEGFVLVKANRKVHKVQLHDISFIESLDEFVKIHTASNVLVTRENITTLSEKLPSSHFVRIHRSFIVSTKYIKSVSAEGVNIGPRVLPFGRAFRNGALSQLGMTSFKL